MKKESLNNLEKDVDIEELSNPYLNIYVYKPYDKTIDNLKPYVFYFPVGQKETEINELIGFFNGKEIKIDAQNPPIIIENPIFVIGENERIHEIKESNDVSFSVKTKTYSARPPYFEEDNGEDGSTGGGSTGGGTNTSGEMKVTYSRFISMSAKRFYEPWGKGDAEVRFIFTKSGYIKRNMVSINPIIDLEVETSTALIDGGYMRQSWWNFYSIDNNKQTAPFVDFTPFDIGNWSNPKTTVYSMRIIEEDKYWGWVGWLLDETRNTKINFVDFKTVFLNNLNITPQNIVEPAVRTIYNSLVNANDRDRFMAAFNQLKVNTNFYFNTSANNYIYLETNIKTSLALAGVNLLNQVLLANENTDDQIGTDIEIMNQNNKLNYSSDGRFKFKLSHEVMKTKTAILFFLLVSNIYAQQYKEEKLKNIISIKKNLFSTLLLEDNNSLIFNQSKPSSNIFNNTYSDYNISFQRRIGTHFFLGLDYYNFNAYAEINPVSLSLSLAGLERKKFVSKTGIQLFRISGFYDVINKNNLLIRAGIYIPFFENKTKDVTLIYKEKINENNLVSNCTTYNLSKFYLGIVRPEIAVDFLYSFSSLETGISTSWNSAISDNEPIIRFSVVLNIYL